MRIERFRRGAVMMETVIVCVLIAAACMVAVVVFGRAIFRNTDVMNKGVTGRGDAAATALSCPKEGYRKQAEDNIKEAVKFAGEFSDTKE